MVVSVVEGGSVRKRKVTPAERFRQELMAAVAGAEESFSGYCRLAAQAMLQTAMEVEAAAFIGRTAYERREEDEIYQSYRLHCHRFYDASGLRFGLVRAAA